MHEFPNSTWSLFAFLTFKIRQTHGCHFHLRQKQNKAHLNNPSYHGLIVIKYVTISQYLKEWICQPVIHLKVKTNTSASYCNKNTLWTSFILRAILEISGHLWLQGYRTDEFIQTWWLETTKENGFLFCIVRSRFCYCTLEQMKRLRGRRDPLDKRYPNLSLTWAHIN